MTDEKQPKTITNNVSIFLFGSALHSKDPKDIDLLVLYNDKAIQIVEVLDFRKKLKKTIFDIFHIPAHVCLLSFIEIEHHVFIEQENAIQIYPKKPNKTFHRKVFSAMLRSFR